MNFNLLADFLDPRPIQSAMPQITLQAGDWTLTIDPDSGARISSWTITDPDKNTQAHLLHPNPDVGASFVMAPWSNRIADARFSFDGTEHQLKPNHPDGSAIHGVARDLPWAIADRSPVSARLTLDSRTVPVDANSRFPFAFGCAQRFELHPDKLTIDLSVTNLDTKPFPGGCGHHPYFCRSLFHRNDQLTIKAPVRGHYPAEHQIPTGPPKDDDFCAALREGDTFIGSELDEVFTKSHEPIELHWDKSGVRLAIECSETLDHLVVFTPLSAPFVCIEPTTMTNNGFNAKATNTAEVRVLQPGETVQTSLCITRVQ